MSELALDLPDGFHVGLSAGPSEISSLPRVDAVPGSGDEVATQSRKR